MAVNEKKTQTNKKEDESKNKLLKIRQIRGVVGIPKKQREVVKGLGLRKINAEVTRKDCPEIRGMINKVQQLVQVEELK